MFTKYLQSCTDYKEHSKNNVKPKQNQIIFYW